MSPAYHTPARALHVPSTQHCCSGHQLGLCQGADVPSNTPTERALAADCCAEQCLKGTLSLANRRVGAALQACTPMRQALCAAGVLIGVALLAAPSAWASNADTYFLFVRCVC